MSTTGTYHKLHTAKYILQSVHQP